jgi:hypothetical protein
MVKLRYLVGFLFAFNGCELPPDYVSETTKQPTIDSSVKKDSGIERHCGDGTCDEDLGENYWNCLDCVDPYTGGPKDPYCGDGICYNETMLSCWIDCRPERRNPGPDPFPFGPDPPPGPKPGPPPGPKPDPIPFKY